PRGPASTTRGDAREGLPRFLASARHQLSQSGRLASQSRRGSSGTDRPYRSKGRRPHRQSHRKIPRRTEVIAHRHEAETHRPQDAHPVFAGDSLKRCTKDRRPKPAPRILAAKRWTTRLAHNRGPTLAYPAAGPSRW